MITRPLDLASKLRPEPRTLYWLSFVNLGLLALFFAVFGSRFVLAPGLGVDFQLPYVAGAIESARRTTHVISVVKSGQIFTGDGPLTMEEFAKWLPAQAKGTKAPSLLVQMDAGGPMSVFTEVSSVAKKAGFEILLAAGEAPAASAGRR